MLTRFLHTLEIIWINRFFSNFSIMFSSNLSRVAIDKLKHYNPQLDTVALYDIFSLEWKTSLSF